MMYAQATDGVAMMPSVRAKAESDALKKCQKCLKPGHWTYECKSSRVYVVRNSKSAQVRRRGVTTEGRKGGGGCSPGSGSCCCQGGPFHRPPPSPDPW
jgi:hypothetical protein